jgi:hypothetical protein
MTYLKNQQIHLKIPSHARLYAARPRYFRALCGSFTLDSAEYAGNWKNTANGLTEPQRVHEMFVAVALSASSNTCSRIFRVGLRSFRTALNSYLVWGDSSVSTENGCEFNRWMQHHLISYSDDTSPIEPICPAVLNQN